MDSRHFTYTIDGNDCITYVSKEWVDYAKENGAPELTESNVVGKSLWKFISDSDTCLIYQELLKKTRASNSELKIDFRCDSPGTIRLMQIKMAPIGNDLIEFSSTTVAETHRRPIPVVSGKISPKKELINMCSWCKKINLEGKWWELDEAINQSAVFSDWPPKNITHGICADCRHRLLASASSISP